MIRTVSVLCVLLAATSVAWGDSRSRLAKEAGRERSRRQRGMTVEERMADVVMREVAAEHRRMIRREAEILPDYRTEASLIYLDRERAADRDPFSARRERHRLLAAERYKLDGLTYVTASDTRMGSESRVLAARRGGFGTTDALGRAEAWALAGATDLMWRDRQRQAHVIDELMGLADQMEQEAMVGEPQEPKRAAWRRFIDFVIEPFRGEE